MRPRHVKALRLAISPVPRLHPARCVLRIYPETTRDVAQPATHASVLVSEGT